MVLKNSKWDRKAKTKYLKKHGLVKRPPPSDSEQRPKWSSKRPGTTNQQIILEDSDSEWDSEEDEELLNQYYPEIGKQQLTREQKEKIKQQILQDLVEQQENQTEEESEIENNNDKPDGIYLGSEESRNRDNYAKEHKTKLDEYVSKDPVLAKAKKNRKLPKNRMNDNLLEEYGIERYSDTVTKDINDYNLPYYSNKERRNIDKIPANELDGFRIGESSFVDKSKAPYQNNHTLRNLTEEEIKENAERAAKSEQNKFYNQIKTRFNISDTDPNAKSKVIEINNFNANDSDQLRNLNSKLINNDLSMPVIADNELDDDIDILLGDFKSNDETLYNEPEKLQHNDNIDSFLSSLSISNDKKSRAPKNDSISQNSDPMQNQKPIHLEPKKLQDQDFLDDLLN